MIKAIIFDFFGVLEKNGEANQLLLVYIKEKLKPKYKLGVISNSADDWPAKILSAEQIKLFDNVTLSFQAGVAKPEVAIYAMALEKLGVRADEAIFVDDIEAFCGAARSLDMKAIRYDNFPQMSRELQKLLAVAND